MSNKQRLQGLWRASRSSLSGTYPVRGLHDLLQPSCGFEDLFKSFFTISPCKTIAIHHKQRQGLHGLCKGIMVFIRDTKSSWASSSYQELHDPNKGCRVIKSPTVGPRTSRGATASPCWHQWQFHQQFLIILERISNTKQSGSKPNIQIREALPLGALTTCMFEPARGNMD